MLLPATVLTLVLAAEPAKDPAKEPGLTGITQAVELLSLNAKAPVTLSVEAIASRVTLRTADVQALALHLARQRSSLCPEVELEERAVVLTCTNRRLRARLIAGKTLELRELRGLPFSPGEDAAPLPPYPPEALAMGEPCPGSTPFGQAECTYAAKGSLAAARPLYEEALKTVGRGLAEIRLGDLALQQDDPGAALNHYLSAGPAGIQGRLAAARICELTGSCFNPQDVVRTFEATGIPEPLRTELELRQLRLELFNGDLVGVADRMIKRLNTPRRPPLCEGAEPLCQWLILEVLESAPEEPELALSLYLTGDLRNRGPLRLPLARAASRTARELGAPGFAAAVLSSATSVVTREEMSAHLAEVCELFLMAEDTIRASTILDFATSRLGDGLVKSPRWARIARRVTRTRSGPADLAPLHLPGDDDLRQELAGAALAKSRARRALAKEHP